jgi:exodeoxyribonuclease-3
MIGTIVRRGVMIATVAGTLLFSITGCGKKEVTKPSTGDEDTTAKDSLVLPDTLKIVSFNIENGMSLDKGSNYDHFVAWVDSVSPDVFAIEEANGFRQESLEKLAARWGHPYVLTNVKASDNYPVALTSKYPILSRRRITMYVSHGAIFAKLRDADLNIVVTHLWPQSYWHEKGDGLGNAYRLQEINIVLDSTIRKYPSETNWTFMGDFNSVSRKDYYPPDNTQNYDVTDEIEKAGYEDVIHYLHGYKSNQTAEYPWDYYPGHRIDFLFATPSVLSRVVKSYPIHDAFTSKYSDHMHAVCAEILLKK